MAAESFLLEIVTPQQVFYSGEVEMVIVKETSGQEGYMAGHSQALKRLEKGEIKIRELEGKETRTVLIPGGHMFVGKTMAIYARYANWKAEEEKSVK